MAELRTKTADFLANAKQEIADVAPDVLVGVGLLALGALGILASIHLGITTGQAVNLNLAEGPDAGLRYLPAMLADMGLMATAAFGIEYVVDD